MATCTTEFRVIMPLVTSQPMGTSASSASTTIIVLSLRLGKGKRRVVTVMVRLLP